MDDALQNSSGCNMENNSSAVPDSSENDANEVMSKNADISIDSDFQVIDNAQSNPDHAITPMDAGAETPGMSAPVSNGLVVEPAPVTSVSGSNLNSAAEIDSESVEPVLTEVDSAQSQPAAELTESASIECDASIGEVTDSWQPDFSTGASAPSAAAGAVEHEEQQEFDSENDGVLNIDESINSNLDKDNDCASNLQLITDVETEEKSAKEQRSADESTVAKTPDSRSPDAVVKESENLKESIGESMISQPQDNAESKAQSTEDAEKGENIEEQTDSNKNKDANNEAQNEEESSNDNATAAAAEPSTISKNSVPLPIRARPRPGASPMIDLTLSDDEADGSLATSSNARKRTQASISGASTAASTDTATNLTSEKNLKETQDDASLAKRSRSDATLLQGLDSMLESSSSPNGSVFVPPFTLPALSEVTTMVSNRVFRLERDVRFLSDKLERQQSKMRALLTIYRRLDTEILLQKGSRAGGHGNVAAVPVAHANTTAAAVTAAHHHHHQHSHQHQQQAVVMLQTPTHQHQQQQQQFQQLRLQHQQQQPMQQQNLSRLPVAATRQLPSSAPMTIDLTDDEPTLAASATYSATRGGVSTDAGLIGAERRKARTVGASGPNRGAPAGGPQDRGIPAPLPVTPAPVAAVSTSKLPPSRATLTLERTPEGVTLQWDLAEVSFLHAGVKAYEIWSYSEVLDDRHPRRRQPPSCPWAKVGDVKALPLPMSCSLTQIEAGSMFHFAVRALDVYNRYGRWSNVCSVPVPSPARAAQQRSSSSQQLVRA